GANQVSSEEDRASYISSAYAYSYVGMGAFSALVLSFWAPPAMAVGGACLGLASLVGIWVPKPIVLRESQGARGLVLWAESSLFRRASFLGLVVGAGLALAPVQAALVASHPLVFLGAATAGLAGLAFRIWKGRGRTSQLASCQDIL